MKKILSVLLMFFAITTVQAQQKGLYLTADGGLGWTNFGYNLNNGNSRGGLGYGGSLGFQYYFTRHWGFSLSGELFVFNTQSSYTDKTFSFTNQVDDEGDIYDLDIRLQNWKENQTTTFVEVPLMIMYQHKFGEKQMHGFYVGLGAKAQIPIQSTYERGDGNISESAYYPEWALPLGKDGLSVELPQHGYGSNGKRLWSGDNDLKTGFALAGELGALIGLNRRWDLTLGISADYGITDIKNKSEEFIGPSGVQQASYVSENVFYNGVLNSNETDAINTMSVRGKIGVRVKLGKLAEPAKDTIAAPETYTYTVWIRDSLTKKPIVAQAIMACQDCPKPDNKEFYSSEFTAYSVELYPTNTYAGAYTKQGFATHRTTITTTPEGREINILVPLHPELLGNVKTTSNTPLADVNVVVTNPAGKRFELKTDSEGHFAIPSVDAGMLYTVISNKPGYKSDTSYMEIPSDPNILQPSYTVEASAGGIHLKPLRKMVLSALVLFDLGKHSLRPEAKAEINKIIPMLLENPSVRIEVGGHTDSRGSAKLNQTLSQDRANSVRAYLIEQGITPNRVTARGYGYSQLVNKCKSGVKCSEQEHQENRRVEFIFSEKVITVK